MISQHGGFDELDTKMHQIKNSFKAQMQRDTPLKLKYIG